MHTLLKSLLAAGGFALAMQAGAQVTLFSGHDFHGRQFRADGTVWNLDPTGFNDKASSAIVDHGRWLVCEDARFRGNCVTLGPGRYPSLGEMGLNNRISSIRPVETYGYQGGRYDRWHNYGYNDRRDYYGYNRER
jgi:hypothetical protein